LVQNQSHRHCQVLCKACFISIPALVNRLATKQRRVKLAGFCKIFAQLKPLQTNYPHRPYSDQNPSSEYTTSKSKDLAIEDPMTVPKYALTYLFLCIQTYLRWAHNSSSTHKRCKSNKDAKPANPICTGYHFARILVLLITRLSFLFKRVSEPCQPCQN